MESFPLERETGECSMSIQKSVYLTIGKHPSSQKINAFNATAFVPPNFIVAGSNSGTIYRWIIPEKITDAVLYPSFKITKHSGAVQTLVWSDTHQLLFSGSSDCTILVWHIDSRAPPQEPIQTIRCFESTPIQIITYMKYVFVLEKRGITILLQQTIKKSLKKHIIFRKVHFISNDKITKNEFTSICFSPNPTVDNSGHLYAGFQNGSILQIDVQLNEKPTLSTSNPLKKLSDNAIFNMFYVPKESFILIFSYDHNIRVFNLRNYRILCTFNNPQNGYFLSSCYDPDTMQYLLADTNGYLYVCEIQETARVLFQTRIHKQCIGLSQGPNDSFLFLQNEGVSLVKINRGNVKTSYRVHNGNIFYISSIVDNGKRLIVTAADDKYIRFWDTVNFGMRIEHKCETHLSILSVYVDIKERYPTNIIYIITGHDEGKIFFYNITENKHIELPSKHKNSISTMSVIKVEAKIILLSCDYDGVVALWSIDSILENISYAQFSLIKTWKASEKEILTSSSQWVLHEPIYATGGNDNIIHLWHEVNGNYIDEPLKGHNDSITAIVFDGLFLISGSEDLTIRIWDIVNKVQLLVITNLHTKAIRSISLFHNESKFASCDASGVIAIYDYIKKKEIWKVKHLSDCRCIWVDPDNPKRMYACIKFELVPHDIPDESPKGLPPLVGIRSGNIPTIRKTV